MQKNLEPFLQNKTIIGIDPGFDRLGWAVGEVIGRKLHLIDHGLIQTSAKTPIMDRYQQIISALTKILKQYQPSQAAVEELFFSTNKKTALRVSEVRGVIIGQLLNHQVAVFEYHPQSVKLAITGYGKADKLAMAKQLQLELGINTPLVDDELDAIAIALTHGLNLGVL